MRRFHALRILRSESGAAGLEFALVMPFLLVLLAGFAEFGRMILHKHHLEAGMRAAGRHLARLHLPLSPEGVLLCESEAGTPEAMARNVVLFGAPYADPDAKPILPYLVDPASVCFEGPFPATVLGADGKPIPDVHKLRISVSAPYVDMGFLKTLGIDPIVLRAVHEEAWIDE